MVIVAAGFLATFEVHGRLGPRRTGSKRVIGERRTG